MSSLTGTMWIALGALQAQQAGLQTTTNNLANINTPGYSRQRPILEQADPIIQGNIPFGGGVTLKGIESMRTDLLDRQIGEETQQQGNSQAYVNAMNQVQPLFPDDTTGIGQQISAFFQSLNSLSTNPSDGSLRQNVLSAAGNLAAAFNRTSNQLTQVGQQLDLSLQQQVQQVNEISQQIATVNAELAAVSSTGQQYSNFLDQRSALIQQLSGIIDVAQISDGDSLTLTTKQGTALVVGALAYGLTTAVDPTGAQHIYSSQAEDITGQITGGTMGGMLQARDRSIPSLQNQLDSLSSGMVAALNAAHQMGTDLNGNAGGNLFLPITGAGAAAGMAVAFADGSLLAASSDGSSGSNGNLANLSAVAMQAVSDGMTPSEAYANMVFQVGMNISDGNTELATSNAMLQQLQQQKSSISGVSLDEEAANVLLYQRAYQAAAEAITAVNQMLQTAINMGAGR
jgi:flagellar hook-associated protein 1 FlgK